MSSCIFDASAMLAVLNRERGHEIAEPLFVGACVSAVNYGEVLKKAVEHGGSIPRVQLLLMKQNLKIKPFDILHSVKSAEIYPQSKPLGLSFADRACVSLGLMLDLPIVTADEKMAEVDLPLRVNLIRKRQ